MGNALAWSPSHENMSLRQARLEVILPGIFATRAEFPFGGTSPAARAFLVVPNEPFQRTTGRGVQEASNQQQQDRHDNRNNGSMIVYANSYIEEYKKHILEIGGGYPPSYQLLTHRDEASPACNALSSPVFCHSLERSFVEQKGARVDETFEGSEHILQGGTTQNEGTNDFDMSYVWKALHAPGHTPGVALYHYRTKEHNVLFTGDTLYGTSSGELDYAPLFIHAYDNQKDDLANTLELIQTLRPDYIIPGLSSGPFLFEYNDEIIARLKEKLSNE